MPRTVRAPELRGRGWLNTDGPLSLRGLRGRFVLVDFWTFCCINCLHVLEELRPVEEKWSEELVVIGVHSPKFEHEADPAALARAVQRHGVHHPVLDDPDLVTWQAYAAKAWPTLVLIDPEGYVVATYAGEGHAHAVDAFLAESVAEHRARGTLQPGPAAYHPPEAPDTALRFPARAVGGPDDTVLVADTGHDAVVQMRAGEEVRRFAGFREPNGLCRLPDDVAAEVGYDVVVADTVGHRLAAIDSTTGEARTVAGDGRQRMQGDPASSPSLSSPWDVAWWQGRVWIAMAGLHQLWTFDPRTGRVGPAGGTSNEGLLDGPLAEAWFAQPSALAADADRLWVADSETSALRWVEAGHVHTAIGLGLFDFGFRDGDREQGRLQHPLGVRVLTDGTIAICDTYNGAIRGFDPGSGRLRTLAVGLGDPTDLLVADDATYVVESGEHRVVPIVLGEHEASGVSTSTPRPVTEVGPVVRLTCSFTPPPGQEVDERFGPATQLLVTATPDALIRSGGGRGTALERALELDPGVGEGVLHVAARAASCDVGADTGAACRMHQQDWGVPVRVVADGTGSLTLPLGGVDRR